MGGGYPALLPMRRPGPPGRDQRRRLLQRGHLPVPQPLRLVPDPGLHPDQLERGRGRRDDARQQEGTCRRATRPCAPKPASSAATTPTSRRTRPAPENFAKLVTKKYHLSLSDFVQYTYSPDIATFAQSAQQAIVQFKAEGVTTVIIGLGPLLGGSADQGGGDGGLQPRMVPRGHRARPTRTRRSRPSTSRAEVTGHLFGMSELSPPTETSRPDVTGRQAVQEADRAHDPEGHRRRLLLARVHLRRPPGGRPRSHRREPRPWPARDPRPRRADLPVREVELELEPERHGRRGRPHRRRRRPVHVVERRTAPRRSTVQWGPTWPPSAGSASASGSGRRRCLRCSTRAERPQATERCIRTAGPNRVSAGWSATNPTCS